MKNIMIPTKDLTREEWLELRRNGIGGSDASVVMGKNPWRSIQQLWEDKTGKTPVLENSNEYTSVSYTHLQRTQLNNYCKNKVTRIDFTILAKLCEFLDCTPNDILKLK